MYANSLSGDFVYDDRIEILNNATIRSTANLGRVFREPFWAFAQGEKSQNISNYYRPLKSAAYIIGIRLWGFDPLRFHVLTLCLHALAGVLVFILASAIIKDRRYAALAALVFIAHPSATESVAWISSLSSTLFISFYLLALCLYLFRERFRLPETGLALSALCFFAALLSKETALSFPALILLSQVFFNSPERWPRRLAHLALFGFVLAVYMFMRLTALSGFAPTLQLQELSEVQVWASVAHLFARYLAMLLWPVNQSAHHVFHPVLNLSDWRFIVSVIVLLAFLAVAGALFIKRSVLSFYLAWIPFTLIPMFHIRAIGENVFCERYLYLPSIGFALILSHGTALIAERSGRSRTGIIPPVILVLVIAIFSALTVNRNPVWHDNLAFFRHTMRTSPEVKWIHRDFCTAFYHMVRIEEALRCFENYSEKYPGDHSISFNLGGVYATLAGRKLAEGDLEAAEELFTLAEQRLNLAFQGSRRDADLFFNLARIQLERTKIFRMREDFTGAEQATSNAVRLLEQSRGVDPEYFHAYLALGDIYLARARDLKRSADRAYPLTGAAASEELKQESLELAKAAVIELEQAVRLFPRNIQALNALAMAYKEAGRCEEAERTLKSALGLKQESYETLLNLGTLYHECLNRPDLAVDAFLKAIKINPKDPRAKFLLKQTGAASFEQ